MKNILLLLLLFATPLSFAQFIIGQPDDIIVVDSPFDGLATFDLTVNESQTLNGESPSNVSITYHNTLMDAQASVFALPNPTSYNNSANPETIYVRMELVSDPSVSDVTSFDIFVESNFNLGFGNDLIVYEFPFDGSASFDLTQNETQILNGIDPSTVNVSYHNSQAEADFGDFPIANPSGYFNVGNPETVFVRVELVSDPNVFSTTSFDIEVSDDVVNIPDTVFLNTLILDGIDSNNSGNIQSFEALATTVIDVNQGVSDLTGLEAFTNLVELNIAFSSVSSLDVSSNTALEILTYASQFSPISSLDLSNNLNLKTLEIGLPATNNFTIIDLTNNTLLEKLQINQTNIATLDLSNNSNLEYLSFVNNPLLETVFIKNGADESTNVGSGSWLENWLLPNNPSLQYVCADDFQVADIQQWAGTDYVVNSFCSTQPGGDYNTITGTTQFDFNNDGCDASDPVVPYILIEAGPGPSTVTPAVSSDENGVFNYYTGQAGNITFQPYLENPSYFNISPNFPIVNIPIIDNSTTTQDFCLTANGSINDAEVVIAPIDPSNPGFDATYKLVYKNKGNQTLSGNVTFQYDDSVLDFVSSTTPPDAQSTDLLTFNFTNLLPFESRSTEITLNVNGPMETPAVNIDDVLDFTATINIDQTEETPDDNSFVFSEEVVGSYDPNDITCLQGVVVSDAEIGEYLHYMIRFENTGNAAAQKVVVTTDINPADYSLNTLQVLDASHDMFVRNNNGVIEFVFEDIQLAGGGGHGNILLKIKTLPTLTINDEVDIQADIYFDFNFPIVTNIANTSFETLSVNGFETDQNIILYPNPVGDLLFIESQHDLQQIRLFDIQGKQIKVDVNSDQGLNTSIDLSHLSQGIYFINIRTSQGEITKKLIKD
jgi:uncharacterized repeat protein (TIGR01451 family)